MEHLSEVSSLPVSRSPRSKVESSSASSYGSTRSKASSWPTANFESLQRKKSTLSSSTSVRFTAIDDQFCGWLWMRVSKFGRWRHRYFCLNGSMLTYFATFPSEEFLRQASKDTFYLTDGTQPCGVVRVAHVDECDHRLGFKVFGTCGKVIDIRAGRTDERNEWLRALKTPARRKSRSWSVGNMSESMRSRSMSSFASDTTRSTPDRLSIPILTCGWLLKQSDVLRRWNRYFFVVQGGMVSYHATDKPYDVPRRRGYVAGVSVVRTGQGVFEMQIRLKNQAPINVRMSSEEELDEWRSHLLSCVPDSEETPALVNNW